VTYCVLSQSALFFDPNEGDPAMTRTLRRFVAVLSVVLALQFMVTSAAFADLDLPPLDGIYGTTKTNPYPPPEDPSYADYWWRQGWGTSLRPQISLNPPESMVATQDGLIIGTLYTVNQTPVTAINSAAPQNYDFSTWGGTTQNTGPYGPGQDGSFDLAAIAAAAGATPEGVWYLHYKFVSTFRASTLSMHLPFKIDHTAPSRVASITLSTTVSGAPVASETTSTLTASSRAVVKWTAGEQDTLSLIANSGVAYYQVLVDGEPYVPESDEAPEQGRIYSAIWNPHPSQITLEGMPAGRHKVTVLAVDRATNKSVESLPVYFHSDPDTPTVSWLTPTGNTLVPTSKLLSVNASDAAGEPTVVFTIDGSSIATLTAPPYSFDPDMSAYTTTTPIVIGATVTDLLGRSVTSTRAVTYEPSGVAGLVPSSALDLESGASGTSSTNPWYAFAAGDVVSDRRGWGNSLHPDFTLDYPAAAEGILYNVVTTTSTIDVSHPQNYYRASKPTGTHTANTLDMQGIYDYPPVSGWRSAPVPGAHNPLEGVWYFQFVFYDRQGNVSAHTYQGGFKLDFTPPSAITGLAVAPTPTSTPSTTTTTIAGSRVHVSWDASTTYDTLSGVSYYKVLLDGAEVIPTDGVVWDLPNGIPNSATLEDLTPGRHTISICAVDRATNVSALRSITVYSDPDTPTVAITSPSGSAIGVKPTLTAAASDQGGVASVVFRLDGTTVGTFTSAPYSGSVDLSSFASGAHTLSATVTDRFGRQATASKSVTLDKTVLELNSFSRTPKTFYPIRREGYYDYSYIRFKLNKASSVKVTIKNSSGTTVKTLYKTARAATYETIKWDGKWSSDGKAHVGTYYYYLTATDAAANSVAGSRLTTYIKNYQLVRKGGGVKVIRR
jgi:hypothetical protein